MSIIDEDPSLFEDGASATSIAAGTHEYPGNLLTVRCRPSRLSCCIGCIGRKYNLEYGCPICGANTPLIGGTMILYRCERCSSIIIECGCRDVKAVKYVPEIVNTLRDTEDII